MKKFFTLIAAAFVAVSVNAARTTLWESDSPDGTLIEWGNANVEIENVELAAGDILIVTVKSVDKTIDPYPQANLTTPVGSDWTWTNLISGVSMPAAGEYEFPITADMLDNIKSHGRIFFTGTAAYFSKVELQPAVAYNEISLTLVDGHNVLASEFDSYADDLTVRLDIENITDPYKSRSGWDIGGFANINNWSPTYKVTAKDGQTFSLKVTIGDLKTAAKNGTTAYVEDQWHQTGVSFNIYNDCKITAAVVLVPVTTSINSIGVIDDASAPIYNLSGQRVGSDYKGIVIQNGQKRIQK